MAQAKAGAPPSRGCVGAFFPVCLGKSVHAMKARGGFVAPSQFVQVLELDRLNASEKLSLAKAGNKKKKRRKSRRRAKPLPSVNDKENAAPNLRRRQRAAKAARTKAKYAPAAIKAKPDQGIEWRAGLVRWRLGRAVVEGSITAAIGLLCNRLHEVAATAASHAASNAAQAAQAAKVANLAAQASESSSILVAKQMTDWRRAVAADALRAAASSATQAAVVACLAAQASGAAAFLVAQKLEEATELVDRNEELRWEIERLEFAKSELRRRFAEGLLNSGEFETFISGFEEESSAAAVAPASNEHASSWWGSWDWVPGFSFFQAELSI